MCRAETAWLQTQDPFCYAMQKEDAATVGKGVGCCSHFTERQESSDLSKVTHCLNCSRTRSRYKVCRICGPALSQWLLELAGWVATLFKSKTIFARLSMTAGQCVLQVWMPENLTLKSSILNTNPVFFLSLAIPALESPPFMTLIWGTSFWKPIVLKTPLVPSARSLRKKEN